MSQNNDACSRAQQAAMEVLSEECGTGTDDVHQLTDTLFQIGDPDGGGNTVWLEVRISQGHDWKADEANDLSGKVEGAMDVSARNAFCAPEKNLLRCFIKLDVDRLPARRLTVFERDIRDALTGERSLDELNIVDTKVIEEVAPEAL